MKQRNTTITDNVSSSFPWSVYLIFFLFAVILFGIFLGSWFLGLSATTRNVTALQATYEAIYRLDEIQRTVSLVEKNVDENDDEVGLILDEVEWNVKLLHQALTSKYFGLFSATATATANDVEVILSDLKEFRLLVDEKIKNIKQKQDLKSIDIKCKIVFDSIRNRIHAISEKVNQSVVDNRRDSDLIHIGLIIFASFILLVVGLIFFSYERRQTRIKRELIDAELSRRDQEKNLRKSEERYRTLFNTSKDGVFLETIDGTIIDCNIAACEMHGYNKSELVGLSAKLLVPEQVAQNFSDIMDQHVTTGRIYVEAQGRRKDGSVFPTEVNTQFAKLENEEVVFVFVRDISRRIQAEEDLRLVEEQLRQKQKLETIGELASGVSHEINNPINSILNYAQLITKKASADSPLGRYGNEIVLESRRIESISRNFLSFSRVDKDPPSAVDMGEIVEAALSLMQNAIRKSGIQVENSLQCTSPIVFCRASQIQQVLVNLMTNARDSLNTRYGQQDGIKRILITVSKIETNNEALIRTTVEDNGTGISEEIQSKIFDAFFTTKPKDKGTGLGLSVSFGIVREHHGALSVESRMGEFTRFHLDLPTKQQV